MGRKIGIIYCERIQDTSCVGCAKCYKAVNEKTFAFEGMDDVQIVFKTGCGDCPGLVVPRVKLLDGITKGLERPIDVLHLGTCVKLESELVGVVVGTYSSIFVASPVLFWMIRSSATQSQRKRSPSG